MTSNKLIKGNKVLLSKRYRKILYHNSHSYCTRPDGEVLYRDLALALMIRKDTVGTVTSFGALESENPKDKLRCVGVKFDTKIGEYYGYFSEKDLILI